MTEDKKGLATAALVLGVISIFLGFLFGIVAIILGAIVLKKTSATDENKKIRNQARAGLILGIVSFVLLFFLLLIGFIAYVGVLDPSGFVPDDCRLDGNLECTRYILTNEDGLGDEKIAMQIKNNLLEEILVEEIRIKESGRVLWCKTLLGEGSTLPVSIKSGEFGDVQATLSDANCIFDGLTPYDVEVSYVIGDSTVQNVALGSMLTTAR